MTNRPHNVIAIGLVHSAIDYPLLGAETQLSFLILALAIGFGGISCRRDATR